MCTQKDWLQIITVNSTNLTDVSLHRINMVTEEINKYIISPIFSGLSPEDIINSIADIMFVGLYDDELILVQDSVNLTVTFFNLSSGGIMKENLNGTTLDVLSGDDKVILFVDNLNVIERDTNDYRKQGYIAIINPREHKITRFETNFTILHGGYVYEGDYLRLVLVNNTVVDLDLNQLKIEAINKLDISWTPHQLNF